MRDTIKKKQHKRLLGQGLLLPRQHKNSGKELGFAISVVSVRHLKPLGVKFLTTIKKKKIAPEICRMKIISKQTLANKTFSTLAANLFKKLGACRLFFFFCN